MTHAPDHVPVREKVLQTNQLLYSPLSQRTPTEAAEQARLRRQGAPPESHLLSGQPRDADDVCPERRHCEYTNILSIRLYSVALSWRHAAHVHTHNLSLSLSLSLTHTHTHTQTWPHTCMYTYTHTDIHIHLYILTHPSTSTHVCPYTHIPHFPVPLSKLTTPLSRAPPPRAFTL